MWAFLEGVSPMRRGEPATWSDAAFPGDPNHGQLLARGIGQSSFLWRACMHVFEPNMDNLPSMACSFLPLSCVHAFELGDVGGAPTLTA